MSRYTYTNLCSIYSATINGTVHRKTARKDCCFGSSLSKCLRQRNSAQYNIILIKNTSYIEMHENNYCWMTKHQLENYLRRIKSIKDFKFSVYESTYSKTPCFKINLDIVGTKKEITFVLQSIKRTYEFPYNFFLYQAYEMQKLPAFKFDSILNLFNVTWSSFCTRYNSGHSYSGRSYFKKYDELREQLPHVLNVVDLYPNCIESCLIIRPANFNIPCNCNVPSETDTWNEEIFRKFLPTYIKNYKILKR